MPVAAGGDLHYHLSQHGVFSEAEMRFYASEIILGLEHMHSRFVVYRDLKVTVPLSTHPLCGHVEAPQSSRSCGHPTSSRKTPGTSGTLQAPLHPMSHPSHHAQAPPAQVPPMPMGRAEAQGLLHVPAASKHPPG